MARIILKSKYLKPESKNDRGGYVGYIATRTGAVMNLEKLQHIKPTEKQIKLIEQLSDEYPSMKLLRDFKKYREKPSIASASELIDAVCEENYDQITKKEDYLSYIAERPGVVKEGSHGLFSILDEEISLEQIKTQIKNHPGNIWTHIVSLEREDAIEFGYDTLDAWKTLLRKNHFKMAKSMKIDPQNFHWYAAFHDTAHHPHVHIVMYSDDPNQGHLSTKGIDDMKTAFATDIFKDMLGNIYQEKEEIKKKLKEDISTGISKFNFSQDNPIIDELMNDLHESIQEYKGKKTYGYLPKELKVKVDKIMMEIEKIPEIKSLLEKWRELLELQYSLYSDSKEPEFSFVYDKTFRPLKNKIIALAFDYESTLLEDFDKEIMKEQLSVKKHTSKNTSLFSVTGMLLHHLSNLVKKSAGIKQSDIQNDRAIRFKEKLQKITLGQNENDTQQFG